MGKSNTRTSEELTAYDGRLAELLLERQRFLAENAAALRAEGRTNDSEQTRLRSLADETDSGQARPLLEAVFREVFADQTRFLAPLAVAYLGPTATFTQQAALQHFGRGVEYCAQRTIGDVFDAVTRGEATYGVVPVENSTEGAVTHTLDMFLDANVAIRAELNMAIHHNLLCRCETAALERVYSHPQVFGQSRRWLRDNLPGVPLVEVSSTSEAVRRCEAENAAGALASSLAAEQFDIPLRAENIEDFQENTTRFLVLSERADPLPDSDKISLMFVVRDRPGALYDCLQPFHREKVNMTMIESRPSKRRRWEYYFFVDVIGRTDDATVARALDGLRAQCEYVKILGCYPSGHR